MGSVLRTGAPRATWKFLSVATKSGKRVPHAVTSTAVGCNRRKSAKAATTMSWPTAARGGGAGGGVGAGLVFGLKIVGLSYHLCGLGVGLFEGAGYIGLYFHGLLRTRTATV